MRSPEETRRLILIVEDDPGIGALLEDSLVDYGFHVRLATTANQAFQVLETVRPALITLDLGLPTISGRRFFHLLRQNPATTAIAVVIISAERVIEPALQTLAQAVLPKPFTLDQLIETITGVLVAASC